MGDIELYNEYIGGILSSQEKYESIMTDEFENVKEFSSYEIKATARCRFCGKEGLYWKKVNDRWFLYENPNKSHFCEEYVNTKKGE